MAIEWADKLVRPLPNAISVRLEHTGGDARSVTIT
jgi:hypothetical protein